MTVNEKMLYMVELGLKELMKKYKKNQRKGDMVRAKICKETINSIQKLILSMELLGDIESMEPIISNEDIGLIKAKEQNTNLKSSNNKNKKSGWKVKFTDGSEREYIG